MTSDISIRPKRVISRRLSSNLVTGGYAKDSVEKLDFASGIRIREEFF